jgi:ATP-dependent helicase HrpB
MARQVLLDLGALDDDGKITAHGRHMADLPLHPRLAHMILAACKEKTGRLACETAAILSERDPLHFIGREHDADLRLRLDALQAYLSKRPFHIHGCTVDRSAVRHILKVSAVLQQRLVISKKTNRVSDPGRTRRLFRPARTAECQ